MRSVHAASRLGSVVALLLAAGCSSGLDSSSAALRETPVDRPGRSHTPATNAAGRTLEYFGGPVIPNAKVYVVWWGNPANLNPAITAAHGGIADFFAGITNSKFVDWLNEYNTTLNANAGSHSGSAGTNQRIGRGNYAGTLTLSSVPAGNVTDAQIQSTINSAISAGTLPAPDANTIYAIYFPSSVTITLSGSTSCGSFGAYHDVVLETAGPNAYYMVVPDCGDSFSGTTLTTSHELAEAITDGQPTPGSSPDYPQAWNDASGSEVGDLCQSSSGTIATGLGTFTVQGIWDERSQGCLTFRSDAQDFNVGIAPNTAAVAAGASATFQLPTATVAGAAQTLTLSATAPAGVTATISPATVTSGQAATLTVSVANPAVHSGLQIVVRADGAGSETHTAALLLSVGGAAANDFSLSASPASATISAGASASFTVATAVTSGSAQSIALSASGQPAGVTVSFSAAAVTAGSSATMTVAAASTAAAGSYSLTVTGSAASGAHTAPVSLTVTSTTPPPPPPPGGVTNGDFESGTTGWAFTGTSSIAASGCHGGAKCLELGSTAATNGDSSATQTFTAPAGSTGLTVWYKETCPDTVTYDWALATLKDNTAGTTATVIAKACATNAWTAASASVVAGHSYTVTLTSHDDNYAGDPTYTLFDDVALTAGTTPPPPPPPAGGVTNGGFESGATGWTFTGTSSIATSGCHGGTHCALLGSTAATNGDSSATQTFTAPAGTSKLAVWYQETCPDTVTYDWALATLKDNTAGTTATVIAKACATNSWTQATAAVTAGHSYTVTLTSHDDNYAGDPTRTLFDDVSVN